MIKERIPFYNEVVVPYHVVKAGVCAVKRRFPARRMRVIGVTGTNGKTTTCFLIWKMLREAGFNAGVMTTVGWGASEIHKQIEHMTTESSAVLNKRIAQLAKEGVEVLVLEVTSHALAQGRIVGIPIEVAVMTNVTHDHLDYHKTFERYVAAKAKLFRRAKFGVINADDGSAGEFLWALGAKMEGVGGGDEVGSPMMAGWEAGIGAEGELGVKGDVDDGLGVRSDIDGGLEGLRGVENKGSEILEYDGVDGEKVMEGMARWGGKNYALYGIEKGDFRAFDVEMAVSGVKYACGDIIDEEAGGLMMPVVATGEDRKSEGAGGDGRSGSADNSIDKAIAVGKSRGIGGGGGEMKVRNEMKVAVRIPGKFNVYNSLAAVCVGRYFGLSEKAICKGILALEDVEGRMNFVEAGQDFKVLVDYAHTPDAFVKVFEAMGREVSLEKKGVVEEDEKSDKDGKDVGEDEVGKRNDERGRKGARRVGANKKQGGGRIITIHGGAGRRDESTRYERGVLAGQGSDIFIVTEDDTRDEDPKRIAAEFVRGAVEMGMKLGENLFVELDRRMAIRKAVGMAKKGDVVLILGKGHEKTILRAGGAEPFEDLKVAREELERL